MDKSAQKILVTEAGSLLGFSLVKLFLDNDKEVFGVWNDRGLRCY